MVNSRGDILWKCILVWVLLFVASLPLLAQTNHNLSGRVTDSSSGEPLVGAVVEVLNPEEERVDVGTSNLGGYFGFTVPTGNYTLVVEYLGYETCRFEASVAAKGADMGKLSLRSTSYTIEDVRIEGAMMRTSIQGDTTVYNASAFKVAGDADAHKMLAKMPGVAIDNSTIEVNGRSVKRVYVNGKEFFASDPMAAVKNIPADMIDYVETYYKLSDNAEMTGVDDGEGYMAINIVTAEDKKRGVFGKLYMGGGEGRKGVAGGSINYLNQDQHVAVIGLKNNINQMNFSDQDVSALGGSSSNGIFEVKPLRGVSEVGSFGVNYNDHWGKRVKVSFHYFFNDIDNRDQTTSDRITFTATERRVLLDSEAESRSLRQMHRFGGRFDFTLSPKQSISIRPSVVWQSQNNTSRAFNRTDNLNGSDTTFVKYNLSLSEVLQSSVNITNNISYRLRLRQKREFIALTIKTKYADSDYISNPEQYNYKRIEEDEFIPENATSKSFQHQLRKLPSHSLAATISYTSPINRRSLLTAAYTFSRNGSSTDKRVYKSNKVIEDLEACYKPNASTIFDSEYTTHKAGAQYKYSKGKTTVTGGLHYQWVDYVGNYYEPVVNQVQQHYGDVVYSLITNIAFSPISRLKIDAVSSLSNPSPTNLQDVLDTSNSQYLRIGNPDLRQSYLHRINLNWLYTIPRKGTSFSVTSRVRINNSYIADRIVVDSPDYVLPNGELLGEGNQFSKPENMRGYWDARLRIGYGVPIKWFGGNLNLRLGGSVGQVPSILNDTHLMLNTAYGEFVATLSSNISEYLDFTFSYNGRYNLATTRFLNDFVSNDYLTQSALGEVKYVTPHNFMISATAEWYNYIALGTDYTDNRLLCNLYIGRKVLPRNLGEISIGVNDLLNEGGRLSRRSINTTAVTVNTNMGMGRHWLMKFVYNLRLYARKKLPED